MYYDQDVLILNQFVGSDHKVMSREETGLCYGKQRLVQKLVRQAQKCKLLPRPADYEVFGPWDNMNTYVEWPPKRRDQPIKVVQPEYWKTYRKDYLRE